MSELEQSTRQTFKDVEGREWVIDINVSAIKRVQTLIGVNLLEVIEGKLIDQLLSDYVLLVDIIYAICEPQAAKRGVTDEQFGEAMAGDAIDEATRALLAGIVAFCPSPGRRRVLGLAIERVDKAMAKAVERATERMEDGTVDREIDRAMEQSGHGPQSGDAQGF